MKKIAIGLLLIAIMLFGVASPVMAADPPGLEVDIVVVGDNADVEVDVIGDNAEITVNALDSSVYVNDLALQTLVDSTHGHLSWDSGSLAWSRQRDLVLPWLQELSGQSGLTMDGLAGVILNLGVQGSALQDLSKYVGNDLTHDLANQETKLLAQEANLAGQEADLDALRVELARVSEELSIELVIAEDWNTVRHDELVQMIGVLEADSKTRTNALVEAYLEGRTWVFGMALALIACIVVLVVVSVKLGKLQRRRI